MSDIDPNLRLEQERAKRPTDGETVRISGSVQMSRRTLVWIIVALAGLGGIGTWKAFSADGTASATKEQVETADVEERATYGLFLTRDAQREIDLAALATSLNELVAAHKKLRQDCTPRRRRTPGPEPTPVVLTPKPPLPETKEAAAAAAPGGP
jgi:hypothetical protein